MVLQASFLHRSLNSKHQHCETCWTHHQFICTLDSVVTIVIPALVRLWQSSFHAKSQVQTREQVYLRNIRSYSPRTTGLNAQTRKTSLGSAISSCSHDPSTDDNKSDGYLTSVDEPLREKALGHENLISQDKVLLHKEQSLSISCSCQTHPYWLPCFCCSTYLALSHK